MEKGERQAPPFFMSVLEFINGRAFNQFFPAGRAEKAGGIFIIRD
jgi:hypothetical protein